MSKLRRMQAEICFCNQDDTHAATAALIELDFEVEVLDWTDPGGGPHMWVMARHVSELSEHQFLDWVSAIVDPFDGFVVEAGAGWRQAEVQRYYRSRRIVPLDGTLSGRCRGASFEAALAIIGTHRITAMMR